MSRNWAPGIRVASSAPEPAITSLLPTAMSVGTSMVASSFRRDLFARTPHAGGERLQIASGLLGEGPEAPRRVVGARPRCAGASSALAIGPLPTMPRTMLMPSPPRIRLRTRFGWASAKKGGDARAHRIAHHIGPRDAEMIEQPPPVLCHRRRAIRVGIVEFLALSMPPIVKAITRRPAATSVRIQPGSIQLATTLEAKPWMSRMGSPSPSSR